MFRDRKANIIVMSEKLTPHTLSLVVKTTADKVISGELKTFAPLVSLFSWGGKQMSLDEHYQFLPMFAVNQPMHSLYMIARQLGKTVNKTIDSLIRSMIIPYYHQLIVQPRFDQIKRYNSATLQPLMRSVPYYDMYINNEELSHTALRRFKTSSLIYLEHAFLSADRTRGISGASSVWVDELQDVMHEHLKVLAETMSATKLWGHFVGSGTPKTTDTTLGLEWARCSQAEWVIRCTNGICNYLNIPNPEHDMLKMLGKEGLVCAKCGRPLNPLNGGYVHARPQLYSVYPGYHIGQPVSPMHCFSPDNKKWKALLYKMETSLEATFYNEVLGWPYDTSVVPLTLNDLLSDRNQYEITNIGDIPRDLRDRYSYLAAGIDFDGGGAITDSYTSLAIVGVRYGTDTLDCLLSVRYPKGRPPVESIQSIAQWLEAFQVDLMAYDARGAGFLYATLMAQAGINLDTSIPYSYAAPSSGDVIAFHNGTRSDNSYFYSIDKSRSLAVLIEAVKAHKVTVPRFADTAVEWQQNPVLDLLALVEMPSKTRTNDYVYLIGRKSSVPDDFAHALNFACSALWDRFHAYPELGKRYDTKRLEDASLESMDAYARRTFMDWAEFIGMNNDPRFTNPEIFTTKGWSE